MLAVRAGLCVVVVGFDAGAGLGVVVAPPNWARRLRSAVISWLNLASHVAGDVVGFDAGFCAGWGAVQLPPTTLVSSSFVIVCMVMVPFWVREGLSKQVERDCRDCGTDLRPCLIRPSGPGTARSERSPRSLNRSQPAAAASEARP